MSRVAGGPGGDAPAGASRPVARRQRAARRPATVAEELFWDLAGPLLADPAVQRSTMMGLPCLRFDGRFFASLDRRSGALLVKLPARRVAELIAAGPGEPFAPAGRPFREWLAVPTPDRRRWQALLGEAGALAAGAEASAGQAGAGPG
jgi:hypothetical protein